MTSHLNEAMVEEALLSWLADLGYTILHGSAISPGGTSPERDSFRDVILLSRLDRMLRSLNPRVPSSAIDDAIRKLRAAESASLVENNRLFHRFLTDGIPVEYHADDRIVHDTVRLVDADHPAANDWLAVNQFTVVEHHQRRPDVVLFLNGLPLAVIELKNPGDESATVGAAFNQLQTYLQDIPSLFPTNEVLVISDGLDARAGTITADWDRFMPWKTIDGDTLAPASIPALQILTEGMFQPSRFLDLIRNFVVFESDGPQVTKKLAAYHQCHAVNKAVDSTVEAAAVMGDRRAGVVWHTQGSGKSLSMVFYAGKIIQHPAMANPTLVVLTDRNDLDDQLFGTFAACRDLLRQSPVQAENREHLQELLAVAAGGVIFTTIQKFLPEKDQAYPCLSERRNIVVIADEAHRSQYDFIDGFARHLRDALPNASSIGFTGTPLDAADKSTRNVFGDYIDIYDIQQAVEDGATVPIYYEGRLAKLELQAEERPYLDAHFEEITEGEEQAAREKLKSKWARLEAMVGNEARIARIADDIVQHWEQRSAAMTGKAMIVVMSRRIAVDLYNAIVAVRPGWADPDDSRGAIKVVMTGSASDPLPWQQHIRNKPRREALARRFKDPDDGLQLVIVRDMWLTGFDAPCLHTMYVDKPMQGLGLMQAIARVNRVFRDKPGGLVVDYLGLAQQLQEALSHYTEGDREETGVPQEEAVLIMQGKYEVVAGMMHGFDYSRYQATSPGQHLSLVAAGMEHILSLPDGKKRFPTAVTALSQAFALAVPHPEALAIRDEVAYFQALRTAFVKLDNGTRRDGQPGGELDVAIRQIVSQAVAADEVIDIFTAAGLKSPDISILSDDFLREVRGFEHKNLALELLRKLINDEITLRARTNVVQSRSFAEMLERSIRQYQNRAIDTAQVITELIELARELRDARQRGEELGLSDDELAFYDALEVNDSAVQVLGDETLRVIARELADTVRQNATIDWDDRESARAKMRVVVKHLLRKYGYPPDKQAKATETVLEQARVLAGRRAA